MNTSRLAGSAVALTLALFACTGDSDEAALTDAPAPITAPSATTPAATTPPAPTTPAPTVEDDAGTPDPGFEPGTFDPSKLQDLALWLRADSKLMVNANDEVVSWKDLSSNHNDAFPVPKAGPTLFPGNSDLPLGVWFDGKQALTLKDSASLRWKGDFTVVVLAASSQPAGSRGALYGKTAAASPFTGPGMFVNYPTNTKQAHMLGGELSSDTFAINTLQPVDNGQIWMQSFGREGDEVFTVVNGKDAVRAKASKLGDTSAAGSDAFIGGHPQGQGQVTDGVVGVVWEVFAVQHALSLAENMNVLKYAIARYVPAAPPPVEQAPDVMAK